MVDIGNVIKYNTVRSYSMSMPDQNGVRRPVIYNEIPDVTTKLPPDNIKQNIQPLQFDRRQ